MRKILLVEDDEMFGMVLTDQLEMNGYEVEHLSQPGLTVDKLLEDVYDLVIMDKLLKGIDGTAVCREIRNTVGTSEIPILMMSGLDGARQTCIDAGANDFIAKPFEISELLVRIEAAIEKEGDLRGN